jgi:hypothetical protein
MVTLPPNESFAAASGVINAAFLEHVYHSNIDETFVVLGRDVTLHLQPIEEQQDDVTQAQPQASQINSFFGGRVAVPRVTTRYSGTKITHRDVTYQGQIVIGPIKEGEDKLGIGDLAANQAAATLDIGAISHLRETLSVTIEGRRYSINETRPIGFTVRRYIIVILDEINEKDADQTGTNG